jgi:Protein of unknown function (DUF3179)
MVKTRFRTVFIKIPIIAAGMAVLSLIASFILTDPAPATLPRRTIQALAGIVPIGNSPPKNSSNPPLVNFPIAKAEDVGAQIRDEYFIVGVELNGEARAYPLNMLSRPDHHVIDDILGGEPIAVTWCGLCQSPRVFERQVDDKTLTFFVPGELYGENMMMRDVETGSGWPQMLGEAIDGQLAGKSLQQLPSVWTDWKTWRTEHPETTVVMIPQTVEYYRHDSEDTNPPWEKRYFSNLQWGFVRGERALSWPLKELAERGAVNDSFAGQPLVVIYESRSATVAAFDRRVGKRELTFRLEKDSLIDEQTSSVWDPVTGRAREGSLAGSRLAPIAGTVSHRRAWQTMHPHTEVHTVNGG